MRMNMAYGLDQSLMTNTDSPRLAVTPGEWYASETIRMIRTDLRQINGFTRIIGAMCDCWTVWGCPQLDSAAADCGAVGLDDFIFRRTSFPRDRDYIWRDLWTGLSVCNLSVTGSLTFGSSHRLGRCWQPSLFAGGGVRKLAVTSSSPGG